MGQTNRVTPYWLRTLTEENTLIWQIWVSTGHVRRGLDKSGGVQIPTIILFTGHVWSKTRQVWKTSLESGKGTRQVRWTGVALGQVQLA
jgi:hypothetical protein